MMNNKRYPRLARKGVGWSSQKVFDFLHGHITDRIRFPHAWQPVVVTLWAMGTYLYRAFYAYGHLWLNSPTTHSGKTKLLGVLSTICYEATEPQLETTAAVLFRFPKQIGGTLILDEVDNLDPKKRGDVISVLNHYTYSGEVYRNVTRGKNNYVLEKFPVFCPKVIAGIESLPVTLQDRCLRVILHRKRASDPVKRSLPEDRMKMEPVRRQLEIWRARKARAIRHAYRDRKRLGIPDAVDDDRVREILEPLFAIASTMSGEVRSKLAEGAAELCRGRKDEEAEANPVVAAIQTLVNRFPKGMEVWPLGGAEAAEMFEEIPGLEDKAQVLKTLRKLGFRSQAVRLGPSKVRRAYRVTRKRLEHLSRHYS